jgi:hypothetical protein
METYVIVLGVVCCLIVAALGGVGIWYATRAPEEKTPAVPTKPTPQPVAATDVAIPQAPLQAPVSAPTTMVPAAAPSACTPDDPAKWDYVRRVDAGGKWVCPSGTTDTGW